MNTENILVSIIVPIYRIKREYLIKCIESLVSQTHTNTEIILIDDGSPDDCGKICDSYSEIFSVIKVIHQENQGVSVARNRGIEESSGEYIIFVDPDDWIEKECVKIVLNEIIKQKTDILFFQRQTEGLKRSIFPRKQSRYIEANELNAIQLAILKGGYYDHFDPKPPWGKIIKKALIVENNLFFPVGIKKAQDVIFNLYLYEKAQSSYYLDYIGYHYRLNTNSVNFKYNPDISQIIIRVLTECEKFINLHYCDEVDYKKALGYCSVKLMSTLEDVYISHPECNLSMKEKVAASKKYLKEEIVQKYISFCTLKDFKTMNEKIRYLLEKQKNLYLYSFYFRFIKGKKIKNRMEEE